MHRSLGELPAEAVVALVKANWVEFYKRLGRWPGSELAVGPHLSWLVTSIPDPFLNVVFRTELPPGGPSSVIDEAVDHFRSRHVTRLSWWVEVAGGEVGEQLTRHGLTFTGGSAMAADLASLSLDDPDPIGLDIAQVEDRASLGSWVHVMGVNFGLPEHAEQELFELFATVSLEPPMTTYLGMLDGRPVATAQLFGGAGVAGIYNVTCLPEARGRGIGAALTRAPLVEARRHGYDVGILQASDLGYPVYRRLGFQDYGRLATYELTAEAT